MKTYKQFYGVDVSKRTVDIAYKSGDINVHKKFTNDAQGMEQLTQWLVNNRASPDDTLFCMEATGLYCFTLTHFLCSKSIDVWVEHSTAIKKATAMPRGKLLRQVLTRSIISCIIVSNFPSPELVIAYIRHGMYFSVYVQ